MEVYSLEEKAQPFPLRLCILQASIMIVLQFQAMLLLFEDQMTRQPLTRTQFLIMILKIYK